MVEITSVSIEEYAKALIDKYISILKQGVSKNFIHHYARKCALEDITNSIKTTKEMSPHTLGLGVNLIILEEIKDYIKEYKF